MCPVRLYCLLFIKAHVTPYSQRYYKEILQKLCHKPCNIFLFECRAIQLLIWKYWLHKIQCWPFFVSFCNVLTCLIFHLLYSRWAWWWRQTFRRKEERTNNTCCFSITGKPRSKRRKVPRKTVTFLFCLALLMANTNDILCFCIFLFCSSRWVKFSHCSHSSSSSNSSSKSEPTEVSTNSLINTFPRAPTTSDSIRLKCRELIANALQTGGNHVVITTLRHLQQRIYVTVSGYVALFTRVFHKFLLSLWLSSVFLP